MMWVLLTKPMQKSVIKACLHCSFARLKNKHMGVLGTNVATMSWLHWSPVLGISLSQWDNAAVTDFLTTLDLGSSLILFAIACHLPYTLLVHCTYQIHCDFYKSISNWIKNPGNPLQFHTLQIQWQQVFMLFISYSDRSSRRNIFCWMERAKQSRCKRWRWSEKKTIYWNLRVMLLY